MADRYLGATSNIRRPWASLVGLSLSHKRMHQLRCPHIFWGTRDSHPTPESRVPLFQPLCVRTKHGHNKISGEMDSYGFHLEFLDVSEYVHPRDSNVWHICIHSRMLAPETTYDILSLILVLKSTWILFYNLIMILRVNVGCRISIRIARCFRDIHVL